MGTKFAICNSNSKVQSLMVASLYTDHTQLRLELNLNWVKTNR